MGKCYNFLGEKVAAVTHTHTHVEFGTFDQFKSARVLHHARKEREWYTQADSGSAAGVRWLQHHLNCHPSHLHMQDRWSWHIYHHLG